jgi:hypothetical protein
MPIDPPRSLAKYKNFPSGDHTGAKSAAMSAVTGTLVPPAAGMVARSRRPASFVQKAIRAPDGDHEG